MGHSRALAVSLERSIYHRTGLRSSSSRISGQYCRSQGSAVRCSPALDRIIFCTGLRARSPSSLRLEAASGRQRGRLDCHSSTLRHRELSRAFAKHGILTHQRHHRLRLLLLEHDWLRCISHLWRPVVPSRILHDFSDAHPLPLRPAVFPREPGLVHEERS